MTEQRDGVAPRSTASRPRPARWSTPPNGDRLRGVNRTDQDFADLEETVRAEAAVEDLEGRRPLIRNLVAEVRVEGGGRYLRPKFRIPPRGVRILSRVVHPASHKTNPVALIEGNPIDLAAVTGRAGQPKRRSGARGSR